MTWHFVDALEFTMKSAQGLREKRTDARQGLHIFNLHGSAGGF